MKYYNIKHPQQQASFKEAVVLGLGKDKGLFFPEYIPSLSQDFIEQLPHLNNFQIAEKVLSTFVDDSLTSGELKGIIEETLNFPFPLIPVADNCFALELFHGPTLAFKDVGARFMSRCLKHFTERKQVHVMVATSGDTGSAVANGFYNVEGVEVSILYPKGKVSPFQEFQMASLGGNVNAIEVNGSFDDCQALVKEAFDDQELNEQLQLSSANSINIARLLPQMLYYFFAYRDIRRSTDADVVFSVPSGNLGNLTAGVIASEMGLPVKKFIAANNANNTFYNYLNTGNYQPVASVQTLSNAMDVGAPSNFDRLYELFKGDLPSFQSRILGYECSDELTLTTILETYRKSNYLLDPHGAVAFSGLKEKLNKNEVGVFLGTAHPKKFEKVIRKAGIDYPSPDCDLNKIEKVTMSNSFSELKRYLLGCLIH